MDEKKAERKTKKFAARLKQTKDIICTDKPTINIVLCNVGQATGLQKEELHNAIRKGLPELTLPKYLAEKGESYSFVIFDAVENSKIFFDNFNGKLKFNNNGPPVYMVYVENAPNTDTLCYEDNPKGLYLLEDFISKTEEDIYLKIFDILEDKESGSLKNRQVKHYGYEFRYGTNDVDLEKPLEDNIPVECDVLWTRLKEHGVDVDGRPDQMTVNKYLPGQGIPSHVDKHSPFKGTILSLSLGSSIVMDWKHHSNKYVPVEVPSKSLLVMSGESRYDWQHGIQPRSWDPVIETRDNPSDPTKHMKVITSDTINRGVRISLTFRWTRQGPCECDYPTLCDSQAKSTEDIEDSVASRLEELHVHQIYEQIAPHFSSTRFKQWARVASFLRDVTPGAILVDLGAGNGKNICQRSDILQIAAERSSGLLSECKSNVQWLACAACVRVDALQCALRDHCADYLVCVAVVHHFSSKARRLQAISTISRLLRKGGKALITVWAKDQTDSNYLCKTKNEEIVKNEEIISVNGVNLPIHENRTQFQHNDLLVPWKLRQQKGNKLENSSQSTLLRYYHVFEEGELAALCREVSDLDVTSNFYEEGNWCVVCTKL